MGVKEASSGISDVDRYVIVRMTSYSVLDIFSAFTPSWEIQQDLKGTVQALFMLKLNSMV
jgi:hypothetical protein